MGTIFINHAKTAMLLGAMTGLFLAVGHALGGPQALLPALLIGLALNVGAWLFSDKLAIATMRGRELTAENGGDLYRMVERLAERAELPMPRVYLCPHDAPNAFATGPWPSRAAVAFTQGAVQTLSAEELEGVAAHELAHIKHRDTLISTVAATIAGVLAFLAQWGFLLGLGRREGGNPFIGLIVIIIAAVGAAVIKAMISRSREYAADAAGARIAGSPRGLASALGTLEAYSRRIPLQQPNPAQNNLFIVEPFSGTGRTLTNLFATHPPTERRIEALRRLESEFGGGVA